MSDGGSVYTREKLVRNFVDSRENVFGMYRDSSENLLETLAVVMAHGMRAFGYLCAYNGISSQ